MATKEFDLLLFAKTHFAEAIRYVRRSGKAFDTNCGAGDDATQWTKKWLFDTAIFTIKA